MVMNPYWPPITLPMLTLIPPKEKDYVLQVARAYHVDASRHRGDFTKRALSGACLRHVRGLTFPLDAQTISTYLAGIPINAR